jgi:hypothetical protein
MRLHSHWVLLCLQRQPRQAQFLGEKDALATELDGFGRQTPQGTSCLCTCAVDATHYSLRPYQHLLTSTQGWQQLQQQLEALRSHC